MSLPIKNEMEFKVGMKVVYIPSMKLLEQGTVGIISSIHEDWCVIYYPEANTVGGKVTLINKDGKIIKKPDSVNFHSAKLTEICLEKDYK